MGAFQRLVFAFLITGILGGPALAERRVALIIGNSNYEKAPRLSNPSSDAALMAETLKAAGFDSVDLRRDLKIVDMRKALRDFIEESRDADFAVVFYAGHGIEVDGVNYLVPVDAVLDRDTDIYDEALSLDRVLVAVEPARKLRLVVLDACRDSPFSRQMKRTLASRAIGRGLAKVEPSSPNTLIAYASKAGSTALDGDGMNSPFTKALVNHVVKPGLDVRKAIGYVRDDVLKSTSNRQEPYLYGSLGGDDLSLVPPPATMGPQADPQTAVRRDYDLALQLGTRDGWEAFLSRYPDGFYSDLAKGQVKKIAAEEIRAAAAEKARLAEQERVRLAAEGARQAEIAKAAAAARAAEDARVAAEKAKQIEQERAAAAERARLTAQENAAAAEKARLAAEKRAEEREQQLAALSPADRPQPSNADIFRSLQVELRRVGCNTGVVDGNWGEPSQQALDLFNKHTGMKLDVKSASTDALEVVKTKTSRICPLVCDPGYRADGDRCTRIVCRSGYAVTDEGTCEKIDSKPTAKRRPEAPARAVETPASAVARADAALNDRTYKTCMGPITGCYARAIQTMSPEKARIWCSRRPTC